MTEFYYIKEKDPELAMDRGINWLCENALQTPDKTGWIAVNDFSDLVQYSRYWPDAARGLKDLVYRFKKIEIGGAFLTYISPLEVPPDGLGRPLLVAMPVIDRWLDQLAGIPNISKALVVFNPLIILKGWIERNKAIDLDAVD